MAGIGFELKKIFNQKTFVSRLQGVSYATMVSAGPMMISILMLFILDRLLKAAHVSIGDRELVNAMIMYDYIFAMIIISGPSMVASRYISDQIYLNKKEGILSSLIGLLAICIAIGGVSGLVFFVLSPISIVLKVLDYQFFIELIILFLLMVYISAARDYKTISAAFVSGFVISLMLGLILYLLGVPIIEASLVGIDIGFLICVIILVRVVKRYFFVQDQDVFSFVKYVRKMPRLIFINFLYALALFSHNFVYWLFSPISTRLMRTYVYTQTYDVATFFAVLTILPATIMFVVKVETSFYEKYAVYTRAITEGGTLKDIDKARTKMKTVLLRELTHIFETQFIISVVLAFLGSKALLPLLGLDTQTIGMFSILCLGFFLTYMSFIIVTILLYFDNQTDSLQITGLLWVSTTCLSLLSLVPGESYYGLGFCLGALITLVFSIFKLFRTLNKIDYLIFSHR